MNRPPRGDEYRRGNSPHMMFQPMACDTPGMSIRVREGSFWINNSDFVEYGGGVSPVIVAPKNGAKWSIVVVNKLGTLLVVDGIAKVNNPELPKLERNLLPIAAIFVKSSTTAITNDMIYDIRPTLAVGGYPLQHNQLQKRDEPNSHVISAITGLEEALEKKVEYLDAKEMLNNKADKSGTTSAFFTLNTDDTGTPVEYCGLRVNRGSQPVAEIRFNEDADCWEFNNGDGLYYQFGSGGGSVLPANSFTRGTVVLSAEPDDLNNPVAVAVNDDLYKSIAGKADKSDLANYVTKDEFELKSAGLANFEDVYSKSDAEAVFLTKAEYVSASSTGTYTKSQVADMLALKANALDTYTKAEVDVFVNAVYTKAEVNAMLALVGGGGGSASVSSSVYTKVEVDSLVQAVAERSYNKDTLDAKLDLKANALDTYTKAEVNNLLALSGSGSGSGTIDGYTKAQVDAKLAQLYTKAEVDTLLTGKAQLAHGHAAIDVVQDANHRMVTEDDVATWDAKQDAIGFTPEDSAKKGVANGYASLDVNGYVPLSQLPPSVTSGSGGGGSGAPTVMLSTYGELALVASPVAGQRAFVIDASADSTVGSGWAEYLYNGTSWVKTGERESIDLIIDWANVLNKPAVYAPDTSALGAYALSANVYTKTEVQNLLTGKADNGHVHDDRYVTLTQLTTALANKLDTSAIDLTKVHDASRLGSYEVDETNVADGRVLTYQQASGKLVYAAVGGGFGGGDNFTLGTKTIDESAIADGYVPTYSQAQGKLVYKGPLGVVGTVRVDESGIDDDKYLGYDLTANRLTYRSLPDRGTKDFDESGIADGKYLAYSSAKDKLVYVNAPSGGSGSGGGTSVVVFEATGSSGGECIVCASSNDVTYSKTGTDVSITPGSGVHVFWVRFKLTETDMASVTKASFNWDTTASDTDYDRCVFPAITIFSDDNGNRAKVKNVAENLNLNAHTVELTGMGHRAYSIRADY